MINQFNYNRRTTHVVQIGSLPLGGQHPIRVQSMGNTDTNDIQASAEQAKRIADAGGELVRFTTQGRKEAENMKLIREALNEMGVQVPLVADVHFQAGVADVAAQHIEKVRINPGNYVDRSRTGKTVEYSDQEYAAELLRIHERFSSFLEICKKHNTAVRIGVNHGSLSERIMGRYGDTPEGIVESCMEFLRICVEKEFTNVVISIKSSNVVVMVQTVRLFAEIMEHEHMTFPIHLGVTEAGDGEDGRIKSAAGIGTLLADGLGDTIRVSLSEDPECEIPVAKTIVEYINKRTYHGLIQGEVHPPALVRNFRRTTIAVGNIGGDNVPVVLGKYGEFNDLIPDYVETDNGWIEPAGYWVPIIELATDELTPERISFLPQQSVLMLTSEHVNLLGDFRAAIHRLMLAGAQQPVLIKINSKATNIEELQISTAVDLGALCLDGLIDGICILHKEIPTAACVETAFGILQATRLRTTKTEFISCPSCGRTMFDLQSTIAKVRAATNHLVGLKIGIMGCIVNGPGEMADADYGYIGAGRGRVSLYKKQSCIEKNIPEDQAVDKLIELIKLNGDWVDME